MRINKTDREVRASIFDRSLKAETYEINWERVQSVYDLKRLLKKIDIKFYGNNVEGIEDLLITRRE